jgi:hypothetical protein
MVVMQLLRRTALHALSLIPERYRNLYVLGNYPRIALTRRTALHVIPESPGRGWRQPDLPAFGSRGQDGSGFHPGW